VLRAVVVVDARGWRVAVGGGDVRGALYFAFDEGHRMSIGEWRSCCGGGSGGGGVVLDDVIDIDSTQYNIWASARVNIMMRCVYTHVTDLRREVGGVQNGKHRTG
jgi:hypothetical protein